MAEVKIDLTPNQDGGCYKVIKKEGSGDEKPCTGCKVSVHYVGTLTDGSKFDSSRDRDELFSFNLGKHQVIKGWDLCVASMKRGEVCVLTCTSEYGYGKRGSPPKIPGGATLVFEIELFDWEGEDVSEAGDKGVLKEIIEEGSNDTEVNEGSKVNINIVGKYNGEVFDNRTNLEFIVGEETEEMKIIPAVLLALKTMKTNEQCRIKINAEYAFMRNDYFAPKVPRDACNVQYTICMNSFVRRKECWEMNDEERLQQAKECKAKGNEFFKVSVLDKAEMFFKRGLEAIETVDAKPEGGDADKEYLKEVESIQKNLYGNMSLVCKKNKKWTQCIQNCDKVLEIDDNNEKALFRKGEALYYEKQYEDAKVFLEKVVASHPNNMARQMLVKTRQLIKNQREQEKKLYANMFDTFAKQDDMSEIRRKENERNEKKKARAERKAAEAQ